MSLLGYLLLSYCDNDLYTDINGMKLTLYTYSFTLKEAETVANFLGLKIINYSN